MEDVVTQSQQAAAFALVAVLASPARQAVAGASPPPVALRLSVGDALSCPSESALREAIVRRLGGLDPFQATARRRFAVAVRRAGGGAMARITLVEADGRPGGTRRILSSTRDCAALFDATALAVALAIDPARAAASTEGSPPPPVERAPAVAVATDAAPTPSSTPSRARRDQLLPRDEVSDIYDLPLDPQRLAALEDEPPPQDDVKPAPLLPPPPRVRPFRRTQVRLSGSFLLGASTAPSTSVGFSGELGVRRPWWSIAVGVRRDLRATIALPGNRFDYDLVLAEAVPCFHYKLFAGCLLLAAGQLHFGYDGLPDVGSPYVAGGARAQLEFPVGDWVELHVRTDLLATMYRGARPEALALPAATGNFAAALAFRLR